MTVTPIENWLPVPGFEGWYEVSNQGRVRRVKPYRNTYIGKIIKPYLAGHGYLYVKLHRLGKRSTRTIHMLVASAFVPNPTGLPDVNHKDTVKTNNRSLNLEWSTHKENMQHANTNGLFLNGESLPQAKLTCARVNQIRGLHSNGERKAHLAKTFGVSWGAIHLIVVGKTWKHVELSAAVESTG
jgi:hypothetical protein